jgi:hypothetical protein
MLKQRSATVQNIQGWAYQDNDWRSGTNEREQHNQVPFDGPNEQGDLQCCSKSSRWLKGYTNTIQASRIWSSRWDSSCEKRNHWYKINTTSCCRNTMTGGHSRIHQENIKTKNFAPTSNLTWLWAAVRKFNVGTNVAGIKWGVQYKCYRILFLFPTVICSP